ncbi:hypothetical protein [Thiobacter aerophilum]
MARLLALNAVLEGARAGVSAHSLAREAQNVDALLERYFIALLAPASHTPLA